MIKNSLILLESWLEMLKDVCLTEQDLNNFNDFKILNFSFKIDCKCKFKIVEIYFTKYLLRNGLNILGLHFLK